MNVTSFVEKNARIQLDRQIPDGATAVIVDSSFNPPHNAHLFLGQQAASHWSDPHVVMLLSTANADKPGQKPEQLQKRLDMVALALRDSSIRPDRRRTALCSEAMFVDKARALKQAMPNVQLVFAMGWDTLVRFCDQKYYKVPISVVLSEFTSLASVVCLTRQGSTSLAEQEGFCRDLDVLFVKKTDYLDVSSSSIREAIASSDWDAVRPLLAPGVLEYIRLHGLYS